MRNGRFISVLAASALLASTAIAQEPAKVTIGSGAKEFPESVTSTADGTLYAGSTTHGVVYKVAPGATAGDTFSAAATVFRRRSCSWR